MVIEEVGAIVAVVEVLDALGVPYALGGSLASAVHGVVRATLDADLVADLRPEHAGPLVQALTGTFYVAADAVHEAIGACGSFNLIHLETLFKVDVFVAGSRPFDRAQLARSRLHLLSEEPEYRVHILSAEDTVLAKLESYRRGGEISERQWRDVLGVLKVQGDRLDRDYMRRMAAGLGVAALLSRAFEEAG